MTKHIPVPPRKVIEELTVYEAVNLMNPDDRFTIEASNEDSARAQLIWKLGYVIIEKGKKYYLADDENEDRVVELESKKLDSAYDEVLRAARWKISEPTLLIGGKDNDE